MENNNTPRLALNPIGSLFSDSWKLYVERFGVLTEIMLLPVLTMVLGEILLALGSLFSILGALVLIVGLILLIFVSLPVIFSIHTSAGVDASYKDTLHLFWPFIWLIILNALAVFGGSFMLIIPGIWLGVALGFARYAFVIEERRGIDALRQSKDYIKGYWWAVLGRSILLGLIFLVAIMVVEAPFGILFGRIGANVAGLLLSVFYVPFAAVYAYKIFGNLRTLKPELVAVQTKERTGFIRAAAIVGLVVPIILIIAGIVLTGAGMLYVMRSGGYRALPPSGYPTQVPLQQ